MKFIKRDRNRGENDAFTLQIEDLLKRDKLIEAVEVRDEHDFLIGWKIQNRYE